MASLGALPAPPAPADAAMAVVGDATPHTARLLLDRLGSADGGAPGDALRRAALLLSGAAAQADGCAETVGPPGSVHALHRGPDGEHDTSGLGRATAMCSALALCVGAAAAAATPPPAADDASLVPATGAGMIPGRPTAASDAEVRELLGSLASSIGALAGVVRTLVERAVDAKPPSAEREQLGGRYGGWYASLLTSRKLGDHARASGLLTPEQSVAARLLAAREPTALLRAAAVREAAAPQLLPLLLTHALARPTLNLLAHGSLGGGDAPAPAAAVTAAPAAAGSSPAKADEAAAAAGPSASANGRARASGHASATARRRARRAAAATATAAARRRRRRRRRCALSGRRRRAQLALHGVLNAAAAVVRLVGAQSYGAARLKRCGGALAHALVPLCVEAPFAFAKNLAHEIAGSLLDREALATWVDLGRLALAGGFLSSLQSRAVSLTTPLHPLLLAHLRECASTIDTLASSRRHSVHLYYAGLARPTPGGADAAPPTVAAEAPHAAGSSHYSRARCVPPCTRAFQSSCSSCSGDCLPRGASSRRRSALTAPSRPPSSPSASGSPASLALDEAALNDLLHQRLFQNSAADAAPPASARTAAAAAAAVVDAGGADGGGGGDTVWSLLCATLTELVDAPTAGVRHASEQAELAARLWRLLSAMVRPAFAAWSPAAAALFGLVRRLAVAQGRLPERVTLSLDLLAMMRNQHASSAAAAAAGGAGGAPSPGRRSASARAAAEAEASAAAEPQAVWLLVEFLQHVAVACRLPPRRRRRRRAVRPQQVAPPLGDVAAVPERRRRRARRSGGEDGARNERCDERRDQ